MHPDLSRALFGTDSPSGHTSWPLLRAAVGRVHPHFFDADTMRAFGSRCLAEPKWTPHPYDAGQPVVAFVTSERDCRSYTGARAWNGARRYSVRYFDGTRVSCIGAYGEYRTRADALRAFRALPTI